MPGKPMDNIVSGMHSHSSYVAVRPSFFYYYYYFAICTASGATKKESRHLAAHKALTILFPDVWKDGATAALELSGQKEATKISVRLLHR